MTDWDDAEKRVELAHELYDRGQWQAALDELKAAIAINPYNSSWHFNLGLTYDALERYQDAMRCYREALEIAPEDVEILCALGVDCNRSGNCEEAITFFERIEKIDASHEPCYCHRIVSYSRQGEHEKAEEMFYLARQYREKCPTCYFHMGSSLFARGLFDRALWCWQQVQMFDPDFPQVHARMADGYWAKGQLQEARTNFIEELRSNPGDLDVMLDLGALLMDLNELAPAAEKFRQVLELSPEESTALYQLGMICLLEHRHEAGLDLFRRALKADRTFPGAHLRIAQIHLREQKNGEGAFHANCELAQQTNDEHTLLELGNVFMDLEAFAPAESTFRRILELNAQNAEARHNLAVMLLKAGRIEEGIEEERRALRTQPKYMLAMHNLALAHLMKKDVTRARYWLREAMDISPDDSQLRQLKTRIRWARWRAAVRQTLMPWWRR